MSRRDPDLLRVGILGLGSELGDWVSGLGGRNMQVVTVDSVETLLDSGLGLAVIFAPPDDAARLAAVIAGEPKAPPTAMIFGPSGEQHPHLQFIRNILDAKNEWERTFDAIVDPVALLDRGGVVRRANRGLAAALGQPIPSVLGLTHLELLGAPAAGDPDPIADSLADGAARTVETSYPRLSGIQQVTVSPHRDGGVLQELVVILKDVNVLKEQQERLRQSARLADIGQLAAGVAHEINTPLASIALRAESLLRSARDERLQAIDAFKNFPRYLQTIDEEIFRCKKIISALLEFSRARPPEMRLTDLNGLAEKAAELVGHQMKLKQIALALDLQQGLPALHADDGQLRQVLIALLMNALDATPAGGHVTIETRRDGNGIVVLTVADDGAGIAPEHLDKIFSPFFTTKPVGQGTGLGLSICHGIVASHGGEFRVESEVGRGTRMSLALPVAEASGPRGPRGEVHG